MIALPLLFGQALALQTHSQFHWQWFLAVHLFGALLQIYILYLNDYADETLDRLNNDYWMSGGSRVIPDGLLTGQQLYHGAMIALVLVLMLGLSSAAFGRGWMSVLTLVALVLGWSYSLPPLKASYRGYGELHQALSCGLVLPVVGYYLQTGEVETFPWLFLLPVCLIFFASNVVTALPDQASDSAGGKLTWPVRYGSQAAMRHVVVLSAIAALLIVVVYQFVTAEVWVSVLIVLPGLLLLVPVGLLQWDSTGVSEKNGLKVFVLLSTMSHAWMLSVWTLILFWLD